MVGFKKEKKGGEKIVEIMRLDVAAVSCPPHTQTCPAPFVRQGKVSNEVSVECKNECNFNVEHAATSFFPSTMKCYIHWQLPLFLRTLCVSNVYAPKFLPE
jgi:hypothetical protein